MVGGAELHGRWLAEQLAAHGHEVEIFTTCALDHTSWHNVLPAGVEDWGRLMVRRYLTDERDVGIHGELERAILSGLPLSREEELLWLRHGVSSTTMEEDLAERGDRYDLVIGIPYLFGTTYFALSASPDNAVIIPCLHDEPYARLGVVHEMLTRFAGIMFNSEPEARLASSLVPDLAPWSIVGLGFDRPGPADSEGFRRRHRLKGHFLLYVGRREAGKNIAGLIESFLRYTSKGDKDVRLVLVGSGEIEIPRVRHVVDLKIDWRTERDAMYRAATIVCQPSVNESLSIVLMQAWLAERAVLVHGSGAVTRYHCERCNGGLWYETYAEFEQVLDRLLGDPGLRATLGRNGRIYVEREYSWEAVLSRFNAAVEQLLSDRSRADTRAGD